MCDELSVSIIFESYKALMLALVYELGLYLTKVFIDTLGGN